MKRQWKDYQIIIIIGIITFGLIGLCDGSVPNCAHHLNGYMYPNTLDCTTFWVCDYERPTLVQCADGLLYDPQLQVCNWWYAVDCGETPIGTTTAKPFTTLQTATDEITTVIISTTTEKSTTKEPDTTTTSEPETTKVPKPETTIAPEPASTQTPEPQMTTTFEPQITTTYQPQISTTYEPQITTTYGPQITTTYEPQVTTTYEPQITTTYEPQITTTYAPQITTTYEPQITTTYEPQITTTYEPQITTTYEPETTTATEPETTAVPQIGTTLISETTTNPSIYPDCNNVDGQVYYPHLTDPRKYFICVGGAPIELQCPIKFLWYQQYINCISTEIPEENCSQDNLHPDDEQYYYQCIEGKPVLSLCPSNLKWNQDLLKCVDETVGQPTYPSCNNTNGQIYFPHLKDITKYYFCAGVYPVELPCPFNFEWYQVYERCVRTDITESEEELIDCTSDKYVRHPADDQMYFECIDNKPIIEVCPSDLKWSQELLDCIKEIPEQTQYPQCDNPTGQIYFPHLTDSTKYYICAGYFAIELSCPSKYFWYQEYQSCGRTEIPEETVDCTSNEQQYIPHTNDEQIYYRCIDETPVQMVCPGSLRWDQALLKCINVVSTPTYPQCENTNDQVYFPHLTDESKYYICAGNFAIELSCPTNFLWNQNYQSCVRIEIPEDEEELIDCTLDEGPQYLPHPENDQLYYHCVDERPILMLCPSYLTWNQALLNCTNEPKPPKYPSCDNQNGQIYFPHLTDSIKYYICVGGFALELSCPAGFLWVQDHQSCAQTETSEQEIDIIDCSLENGPQSAPHNDNGQLYYLCVAEKPVLMLCPSDLKWNNILKKCIDELTPAPTYPYCNNPSGQIYFPHLTDPSKYYICVGEFPVELPCPTNFLWTQAYQSCIRTVTTEEEENINCSTENEQQYAPNEEYYQCIDGKPVVIQCPTDLKWNQELIKCTYQIEPPKYPQCDNPNGQIYFPHLTDSSNYYICVGDFALTLSCPSGFLWVQDHQSCAKTEISEQEITIIDCSVENGPHSTPYEDDEHFYYLCIAEKPVLMLCPSDLKWNRMLQKCTDEITPEPVYPQCHNSNGQIYFPHLIDSSKYYICAGDFAIELSCPIGFLWTQDHQSCARTETPVEEPEVIDCSSESGPQSAPYVQLDQFYYLCVAERPILMLCPSDLKWDQIQQICTVEVIIQPEYPQCDNSAGQVYFAHLTDPNKYYICASGFSIELVCPSGFFWSQNHQSCAKIYKPEEEEIVIDCLSENNPQSIPHEDNDQFYYLCIEEQPVILKCPSDLKWDQNLNICTEAGTIKPEYPQCENSDGQNFYAHLNDANKYYICAGTIPLELSCPANYVWNQDYQSCIANESPNEEYPLVCNKTNNSEHMSHPTDSQKYFICLDRRPALMHCPSNATWNDTIAKCFHQIIIEPSYPPCGTGPIFYPHLTDPKQYYLCSGDYALTMLCPNDYKWSTDINSCIEDIIVTEEPDCAVDCVTCTESGIFLPHPTDVTKYYACVGTPPISILFSCTGNTFWITSFQRCDAPDINNLPSVPSVSFPVPDCSNGAEFLTNYQDCHKYYICIGGTLPLEFSCEKDTYWDPTNNRCVDEKSTCFLK